MSLVPVSSLLTRLQPLVTAAQPAPLSAPTVRAARATDVEEIAALINHYAALGDMLPRKAESVRANLPEFIVVEADGKVIACGALHRWDEASAEVRSLAVSAHYAGKGLGKRIVNELLEQGRARQFTLIFALTLKVGFFEKLGFREVSKSTLPQKIWGDCKRRFEVNLLS